MLNAKQRRSMNDKYRDEQPRELFRAAYRDVLNGNGVSDEQREQMLSALYEPFSDDTKDTPVDPWEPTIVKDEGNGLAKAVEKHEYHLSLHISKKLYWQQPIGVLLRPINDAVQKAGEALITDVSPQSETVEAEIMPAEHYKLRIEPHPLWLEKWVGEDGYPTI